MMKNLLLAFLLILTGSFMGVSQVITFDDQGHTAGQFLPNPYLITNNGETFRFTISGGAATNHIYRTTENLCSSTGMSHIYAGNTSQTTWTIETVSGNEIDLGTIRFDNVFWCSGGFTYNLSIEGFKNGSSTGTQLFSVTGVNSVFTSNANFNDVDRIVISAGDISHLGIDNINWAPSVPPCTEPTIPTITASTNPICAGQSTTLNISGTLNDATQWHVYTGFCGVTPVGTTSGSTFVVSPTSTTSYYIRGEGGCATPGTCGAITVTVNPLDNANFSYSSTAYCTNAADPTPSISGQPGGTFTSTAGLSLNASTGQIDVSASTPGTYTVTYTTNGTCPNSSNVSVTINGLDNASFSYSAASYCVNAADPTPTITGLAGGTFTSTAGLSLNASTGQIDVSASTPGTYTVTYTTSGTCPNASNVSVTINALDNASFTYSASAFCVNAPDPTPSVLGQPGGTFSSTAGLSLNAATGQIDVSASTPGAYAVTYTTNGTCPDASIVSVTINGLDNASFSYSAASYCVNAADPTPVITGVAGGTFTSTAGLSLNSTTGQIDVSASTPGTYTVTYTTSGTCPNASNVSVTINTLDNASFSYSAATYCIAEADPTPVITGLAGGTFSSTAGLSLNTATGQIDLSASTPGTYSVTYTTSGTCPNSASVSVTITALDNASFNYASASFCSGGFNPTPTVTGVAGGTFSSTAGLVFVSTATGEIDLVASTVGTYTVTYTTSGVCGNSSTQSVTIATPPVAPSVVTPVVVCLGNDVILSATGSGTGSIVFRDISNTPIFTGAMPPATVTTNQGALANGTYFFTATEDNGGCESAPTTIEVFVGDTSNPTAVCQDITVFLDAAGTATISANDLDGGSSDNCGSLTYSASQTTFDCSDIGGATAGTLILTGVYDAGLTGGLPKGVELYVANDIADLSQYGLGSANNGGGTDGQEFTFPATSVSAGTYIYVASEVPQFTSFFGFAPDYADGSMGINGDDAIELFHMGSVIDVFGDINVDGTGQPWDYMDGWVYRNNGTGPDGSTFTLGNWTYSGTSVFTGPTTNAAASPSFPLGTFTPASSGSTPVTLTVTDGAGNTAICTANVTVIDSTSPVIMCPGNQLESLDATCGFTLPDYTGLATATDNCGTPTVTQSPAAGTVITADQVVTLTAMDANGNSQTCSFNVIVSDNTPPTAVCQNITVFLDGAGNATITPADLDGGSSDNCGPVTLSASTTAFTCANVGANSVTLTVTDVNANTSSCAATVTVADTTSPIVVCPSDQTETASATCDFTLPDYTSMVLSSDNCGVVTLTQSPVAGTVITSDQLITITGLDASGNSATCAFNIFLTGIAAPTAVCQDITVFLDGSGNATITAADIDGGSTVSCGALNLSASTTSFTCADAGVNNVVLTVTDGGGNTATCTASVTVVDSTSPVIMCPGNQSEVLDATCSFTLPDYTGLATATDNCGTPTVTQSPAAGTAISADQLVTLTATDGSGNTQTCSFNVFVSDNSAPTAVCQNITVYLDGAGNATITAADIDGGSTDNCGTVTLSTSMASFTCADIGANAVILTVTDGSANSSSCTATVTVADTVAPIVSCPGDQTETASATCDFILPDYTGMVTASDNCSAVTLTQSPVAGTVITSDQVILISGMDANGNSTVCSFNVLLTGATPPTAVCQNITVYLDGSGNASITASDIDGGSTAACGGLTLTASTTAFTCADLGANNVTLTATDGGGNTDDCIAVVTVMDTITPIPDAASLQEVIAECEVTSLTAPTALDNCGTVTVTNDATFPIATQGSTTVTWTFDDGNGNTATQTQVVTIIDSNSPLPTAAPLPDVVGQCSVDVMPSAPTAIDACAGPITGVLITPVTFPITTQGTTVLIWQYDDGNGNISTQSQNIIVNDVTGPVPNVTNLPDLTGDCSIDMPTAPTATDNCSGAITATTTTVFPITAVGTTTIVWEFNDGNGNFTTQTQQAINSGIDASATLESDGVTITANTSGGTYAWLNCDFNTTIAGETNQSFTPAANGVYAVIVTLGNCTDTSACITVSSVGVEDLSIEKLAVYPNPSLDGFFTVNFEGTIQAIEVVDMLGRTMALPTDVSTGVVDGSELAQGRYMVRVMTEGTMLTTEIVIVK